MIRLSKASLQTLLIAAILLLTPFAAAAPSAATATVTGNAYADLLVDMGLFRGTSNGYELDREATRVEGIVMLIRLLGKEPEVLARKDATSHFTDVAAWAIPYVNYAYEAGLTKGVGGNRFAPQQKLGFNDYATFALRALGYSEAAGDFTWKTAPAKAQSIGMLPSAGEFSKRTFTRGRIAQFSIYALRTKMKTGTDTLARILSGRGVLDAGDVTSLNEIHSPAAYGARGDGTTDDSAAFTSMLEQLDYDEIVDLGSRTYNLGGKTIRAYRGVRFSGPGRLINGTIMMHTITDFSFDSIDTENFTIQVFNTTNAQITNSSFANLNADVDGFIEVRRTSGNVKVSGNSFRNIGYLTNATAFGCGVKFICENAAMDGLTITGNTFDQIKGPAAIWLGGSSARIANVVVSGNTIRNTESFGILVFQYDNSLSAENISIKNNTLRQIGSIRTYNYGNGASGIYNNMAYASISAVGNDIRTVLEVGIEGYYTLIEGNHIEDTGADQLYHPITDSAGIYTAGPLIRNNTIINPGFYGGIHFFSNGTINGKEVTGNVIRNDFRYWSSKTAYSVGDLVVADGSWYRCVQAGTSGTTNPALSGKAGAIQDGTVRWDYKKPFAQQGITFNGVNGVEYITITGNRSIGVPYFVYLSSMLHHVTVKDNSHGTSTLTHGEATGYLTGYGARSGDTVLVQE